MSNILLKPYFWKLLIKKINSSLFLKIKDSRFKQFYLTIFMLPSIFVLAFITMLQLKQIYLGEMSKKIWANGTNGETAVLFWICVFFAYFFFSKLLGAILIKDENEEPRMFWLLMGILTFISFTLTAVGFYLNTILIPTLLLLSIAGGFIFFIVIRTADFNVE